MAKEILFSVTPPPGVTTEFKGTKPQIDNDDFQGGEYQKATSFTDSTVVQHDREGNPQGITQKNYHLTKKVDNDTPFFKECCHSSLVIPEIKFTLFEKLKGDTYSVPFFTITLSDVVVTEDTIKLLDTNVEDNRSIHYVEEILLSAQKVKWEYDRDALSYSTEFKVP